MGINLSNTSWSIFERGKMLSMNEQAKAIQERRLRAEIKIIQRLKLRKNKCHDHKEKIGKIESL